MPRFVVLLHDLPPPAERGLHWDLMLEHGARLRTWALKVPPLPPVRMEAELLPDHRLQYLEYEGVVSGGRGRVARWDQGTYVLLAADEHCWEAELYGRFARGRLRLVHEAAQRWNLSLLNDSLNTTGWRGLPT
jgi:hypothetical protein